MRVIQRAKAWAIYIVGFVVLLVLTISLASYLTPPNGDIATVGLPLLLVFALVGNKWADFTLR